MQSYAIMCYSRDCRKLYNRRDVTMSRGEGRYRGKISRVQGVKLGRVRAAARAASHGGGAASYGKERVAEGGETPPWKGVSPYLGPSP